MVAHFPGAVWWQASYWCGNFLACLMSSTAKGDHHGHSIPYLILIFLRNGVKIGGEGKVKHGFNPSNNSYVIELGLKV